MKTELIELIQAFVTSVEETNKRRPFLEDDIMLTFENFIKWLNWQDAD